MKKSLLMAAVISAVAVTACSRGKAAKETPAAGQKPVSLQQNLEKGPFSGPCESSGSYNYSASQRTQISFSKDGVVEKSVQLFATPNCKGDAVASNSLEKQSYKVADEKSGQLEIAEIPAEGQKVSSETIRWKVDFKGNTLTINSVDEHGETLVGVYNR